MVRGVVSRVKIMSSLDISERRVPQDGRLSLSVAGRTVDVRVVTLPLVQGESVVMRLLDQSQGIALAEVQKREAEWRAAEGNLRAAEAAGTAADNDDVIFVINDFVALSHVFFLPSSPRR